MVFPSLNDEIDNNDEERESFALDISNVTSDAEKVIQPQDRIVVIPKPVQPNLSEAAILEAYFEHFGDEEST